MVKVCEHLFKPGADNNLRKPGFTMDRLFKGNFDIYLKNIQFDRSYLIIISANGRVREGKSYLAAQIGAYWTSEIERLYGIKIPFNLNDNYVFNGSDLIKKGNDLGSKHKYACLIFDEAGADLESSKVLSASTKAVKDYLRESGMYNQLVILVIPEFFDLPKGIALSRSELLLNVYSTPDEDDIFQRGRVEFFNIPKKTKLYLEGKQTLNYNAAKPDFRFTFPNFLPFNTKEYEQAKQKALKNRESNEIDKKLLLRNIAWKILHEQFGMSQVDIAEKSKEMGCYCAKQTISNALQTLSERDTLPDEIIKLKAELELKTKMLALTTRPSPKSHT